LLAYLEQNEPQVRRNLATKLLGYALGRTVQASDLPLIEQLVQRGGDASFSELAETIATSRQFRFRRGAQQVSESGGQDVADASGTTDLGEKKTDENFQPRRRRPVAPQLSEWSGRRPGAAVARVAAARRPRRAVHARL
jgi:hypothetical protein